MNLRSRPAWQQLLVVCLIAAVVAALLRGIVSDSVRMERWVDIGTGRMKTVTRDGGRVLKEEEDHNEFVALSERVGIEVYQVPPVWAKLGTRRMSDHGFGQSYLGRVSAFYDDVALAVELAHLDDDQCREAIQIAKVVGAKAGPGRLVGDARLSGSRVEIRGEDGSLVWTSK
jgi:hypothetical protein